MEANLDAQEAMLNLLYGTIKFGASDLHLKVGYPPFYRVAGQGGRIHA